MGVDSTERRKDIKRVGSPVVMINLDDGGLHSPRSNINPDDVANKTGNESFAGDIN